MVDLTVLKSGSHDLQLIGLSLLLAIFSAYLTFHPASRSITRRDRARLLLLLTPSFAVGILLALLGLISTSVAAAVTLSLTLILSVLDRRFSRQALAVEESELDYRELVESAQVILWQCDLGLDRLTFVSHQAEALLGFTCDQWLSEPGFWERQVYAADRHLVSAHLRNAVASLSAEPVEHRMCARDGSLVWVRTAMRLVHKRKGRRELVALMLDITQRKQAEEALEEQRRLFAALMDASPACIYFKDLNSRFVRVNKAGAAAFGVEDPQQLIGKSDIDFFAGQHATQALKDEQLIIATGEPLVDYEEIETWPDGRIDWASTTKMPLRNSQNEICGTIGISRNITERKLAQESLQERTRELLKTNAALEQQIIERRFLEGQLVQAQKLESIGQLAAGVAHEINTPIQYVGDNCRFFADSFLQIASILGQYELLMGYVKQSSDASELVKRIERTSEDIDLAYLLEEIPHAIEQCNEGVERVAHIVRAMKEFSHPGSARMEAVDLNHAIKSTLTVCRNEWKYVADAVTQLDPALPPVRCLAGEINQVFLNIVVNAAHAIADSRRESGGKITLTTRLDGDVAEIRIGDNGTGISPSVQSRIFDPFFTTKEVGRGSGQGLALARNVIVKKHGGTLTFETVSGEGTVFIIRLPVAGISLEEDVTLLPGFAEEEVLLAS